MSPFAALWSVPLLFTLASATTCNSTVACPCGSSNYTHALCLDDIRDKENPCDIWSQCKTCYDNTPHCATCPENRKGHTCLEVKQTRRKRQYPTYPTNQVQTINPSFFGSCRRLESPELGSITCRQRGNLRSCTGRCLPGYSFTNENGDEIPQQEITLQCRRNTWEPFRSFPPCRSGGHCRIEVQGAGSYNCTTGMDGTRCDIFCDGNYLGRYHCYPGRGWETELPYCATEKGISSDRSPPCSCLNNGYCDSDGMCVCSLGWEGTNCERSNVVTCPDPGYPRGGDRVNGDGSLTADSRPYQVGESVVFSCKSRNSALQGSSIITCRGNGTWSASRPRCLRTSQTPSAVCPVPGVVSNAIRLNTDGSPSEADQVYTAGQSVVYSCKDGYALRGTSMITCLRTRQWSSAKPRCTRIKEPTPDITESPVDPDDDTICNQPEADLNGIIEDHPLLDPRRGDNKFPAGTQLSFSCREGYQSVGPVILFCLRTGDWSSPPPTCEETFPTTTETQPRDNRITCKHPGLDPNGDIEDTPLLDPRKKSQRFPPGTELTYTCKEGYELEGTDVIECLRNGDWTDPAPSCVNRTSTMGRDLMCQNLGPISNGRVVVYRTLDERRRPEDMSPEDDDSEYPMGTRLHFSCEIGYTLIGRPRLACRSTGFWNSDPPICVEDCGRSLLQTTHKVTHGTRTVAGEWPWVVAIAATSRFNVTSVICGGALLDRRTVMTAAHCLTDYSVFTLYFGKFHRKDRDDDGKVFTAMTTRIVSHRRFNVTTYENDIALLRFEPYVRYSERIQTICLPTTKSTLRNLVPGNKGYVTGWGITEDGVLSDELLMANLPVQPQDKCIDAFEAQGLPQSMRPGMFCAGLDAGVVSACRGDSGAPFVFYDNRTDRHTIEGMVSFGTNGECGQPNRYTAFTKVSDYMPWILKNWPR